MEEILKTLQPMLAEIVGLVLTAFVAWASLAVRRYFGAKTESLMRDALHRALQSGAAASDGATASEIAKDAINYAHRSVADKIKTLNPLDSVLADLAYAKAKDELASDRIMGKVRPPR